MNPSDKLFMETAEKQQEIIDVLLEACKEIKTNLDFNGGIVMEKTYKKLQQAINQTESK